VGFFYYNVGGGGGGGTIEGPLTIDATETGANLTVYGYSDGSDVVVARSDSGGDAVSGFANDVDGANAGYGIHGVVSENDSIGSGVDLISGFFSSILIGTDVSGDSATAAQFSAANGGTGNPASLIGTQILSPQNTGGGTVALTCGVEIEDQNIGSPTTSIALKIDDQTAGGYGIQLGAYAPVKLGTVAIANLSHIPAVAGNTIWCTDAKGPQDSATWGSIAASGGSGSLLVYDGTNWRVR
jgi:hypothetical protein